MKKFTLIKLSLLLLISSFSFGMKNSSDYLFDKPCDNIKHLGLVSICYLGEYPEFFASGDNTINRNEDGYDLEIKREGDDDIIIEDVAEHYINPLLLGGKDGKSTVVYMYYRLKSDKKCAIDGKNKRIDENLCSSPRKLELKVESRMWIHEKEAPITKEKLKACQKATNNTANYKNCMESDVQTERLLACGRATNAVALFSACLEINENYNYLTVEDIDFCGEEFWGLYRFRKCLKELDNAQSI